MKHDWSAAEAWGKTSAVLVASTAVYLAFSVFCAVGWPGDESLAVAVGLLAGFPVWVGSMCYAVLARTTARAWGVLLTFAIVLGGGALLADSLL